MTRKHRIASPEPRVLLEKEVFQSSLKGQQTLLECNRLVCPHCDCDCKLHLVDEREPWNEKFWLCESCNSTFFFEEG